MRGGEGVERWEIEKRKKGKYVNKLRQKKTENVKLTEKEIVLREKFTLLIGDKKKILIYHTACK